MEVITHLEGERITYSRNIPIYDESHAPVVEISLAEETKFNRLSKGLTYQDLVKDDAFNGKENVPSAQDTLRYYHREGLQLKAIREEIIPLQVGRDEEDQEFNRFVKLEAGLK